jgi:ABC-type Na+ efflux pump permease subunit
VSKGKRVIVAVILSLLEILAWSCYISVRIRCYLDLLAKVPPLSWDAATLVLAFAFELVIAVVALLAAVALTLEIANVLNSGAPPYFA